MRAGTNAVLRKVWLLVVLLFALSAVFSAVALAARTEAIIVVTYEEDMTILDLRDDMTFLDVKRAIAADTGISPERQRLFLGENEMADTDFLADYWDWLTRYPLIEVRDGYVAPPPTGDGAVCLWLAALVLSGVGLIVLKRSFRKAVL